MKVLIPGGHLTPALAFIEYLQTQHSEVEIVFCGRQFSQDTLQQKSQEEAEILKRQVKFIMFAAPRWDYASIATKLAYPIVLIGSLLRALTILNQERPDVILSFGGYLAVPLAMAGYLSGRPVVTHEQTRSIGSANRFMARFARKIALTYPETAVGLPADKVAITGNPLRMSLFQKQAQPTWIARSLEKPVLYITGGNQGSEIINVTVQQGLRHLLKDWTIIHQCGNPTQRRQYKQELEQAKQKLPLNLQAKYYVREWLNEEELGWVYQQAQVVVSRAGANTVLELAAHHIPSVLIPLPFAHGDEQHLNARYLADRGGATLLHQRDLSVTSLQTAIETTYAHHRAMRSKLKQLVVPTDASAKLYQVLSALI